MSSAPIVAEEGLPTLGQSFPDHLLAPDPGAGSGLIFKLDARWWWRFVSARFLLSTDANVGNRFVTVDYCDPEGTAWIRNPSLTVFAANVVNQEFDFAIRSVDVSGIAGEPQFASLVPAIIPGGWQLRVNIDGIKAGDTITGTRLYVEKFQPVG